ncbi:hypothetical protein ACTXT7_004370 [Hymenolepis weldensis]
MTLLKIFNSLSAKIKTPLAKFEGLAHVNASVFSVSSSCSIKPFASIEIPDPTTAEDVPKNVPELILNQKSEKHFLSLYNKQTCVHDESYRMEWEFFLRLNSD